jgi:hypothetical protein
VFVLLRHTLTPNSPLRRPHPSGRSDHTVSLDGMWTDRETYALTCDG